MQKEDVQSIAFQLIAHAGVAYDNFNHSIELAQKGDLEGARKFMKEGEVSLNKAHKGQTDLLVSETRNEDIPFSILMVHAQDHLTMAIFSQRMAKHFIKLWEELNNER